ncbi:MAG TPA: hypothetical protein VLE96_06330 [Chlamydiales bacterium]|nr:hypothetical protein [Chlamydiales bacterium]
MTDKDRMTRKLWLLSAIIITIGNMIFTYSQQMLPELSSLHLFVMAIVFFTTFVMMYIYYYCAYKKPGTKLLTFSLVAIPISWIANVFIFFLTNVPLSQSGLHPLQLIPAIWLYVLSWKMRKINKKLQSA